MDLVAGARITLRTPAKAVDVQRLYEMARAGIEPATPRFPGTLCPSICAAKPLQIGRFSQAARRRDTRGFVLIPGGSGPERGNEVHCPVRLFAAQTYVVSLGGSPTYWMVGPSLLTEREHELGANANDCVSSIARAGARLLTRAVS